MTRVIATTASLGAVVVLAWGTACLAVLRATREVVLADIGGHDMVYGDAED